VAAAPVRAITSPGTGPLATEVAVTPAAAMAVAEAVEAAVVAPAGMRLLARATAVLVTPTSGPRQRMALGLALRSSRQPDRGAAAGLGRRGLRARPMLSWRMPSWRMPSWRMPNSPWLSRPMLSRPLLRPPRRPAPSLPRSSPPRLGRPRLPMAWPGRSRAQKRRPAKPPAGQAPTARAGPGQADRAGPRRPRLALNPSHPLTARQSSQPTAEDPRGLIRFMVGAHTGSGGPAAR
jgi:hypothetical protein